MLKTAQCRKRKPHKRTIITMNYFPISTNILRGGISEILVGNLLHTIAQSEHCWVLNSKVVDWLTFSCQFEVSMAASKSPNNLTTKQ